MDRMSVPAANQNIDNITWIQQKENTDQVLYSQLNSASDIRRVEDDKHKVKDIVEIENLEIDPDERKDQGQQRQKKQDDSRKNKDGESGMLVDFSA